MFLSFFSIFLSLFLTNLISFTFVFDIIQTGRSLLLRHFQFFAFFIHLFKKIKIQSRRWMSLVTALGMSHLEYDVGGELRPVPFLILKLFQRVWVSN